MEFKLDLDWIEFGKNGMQIGEEDIEKSVPNYEKTYENTPIFQWHYITCNMD